MTCSTKENKPRPRRALKRFAVHILAGDVYRVEVMARDDVHASMLAETEYARCEGTPGKFIECDHMELDCYRMTEDGKWVAC